ncbi:MAG: helix-turn-helix domain-containing protein [Muribaculaceae bacterium]
MRDKRLKHVFAGLCGMAVRVCVCACAFFGVAQIGHAEQSARELIEGYESASNRLAVANELLRLLHDEEFFDEELVLGADVPADSVNQVFYYWAGEWYCAEQEYGKSLSYGLKALPLYNGVSDAKADCLNLLGVVSVRLGDFVNAVVYTKGCLDIDMHSGDADRIAHSISTLAGTYLAADKPEDALRYALLGLTYAKDGSKTLRKSILLGMASESSCKLKQYDKALEYAEEAYQLDSIGLRAARVGIRLSQKAAALIGLNRYAQAEACFAQAEPLLIEAGNYHSLAINYNQMGYMLLKQERDREAIDCFRKAGTLFDKMGDLYNQLHSQQGLLEAYWEISPDSARWALEQYNQLKDSLYNQASADALARYKVEFDTDLLKDEIAQRRWAHRRDVAIAVVALVALALIGAACYRYKVRAYRRENVLLMAKIEDINTALEADKVQTAAVDEVAEIDVNKQKVETKDVSHIELLVVEAVNEGLAKGEYSVSHIAAKLNMGEQTFRRRFVEATGKQPKAFISAIQMERAATLLSSGKDITIAEIASECGFDEPSAFSHAFRKAFGCTPTVFRANGAETRRQA